MDVTTLIGSVGGFLTTLAALPQAIKSWREKSAKDISLYMYIILNVGIMLWLIYGILINDFVVIVANLVSLIINLIILYLKLRYG